MMTPIKQYPIPIRKLHTFKFRCTNNNNNNKANQTATTTKTITTIILQKYQPPVQYSKPKICSVK